jgi:stage II sporulation protein AB (anti-sigma F factor)
MKLEIRALPENVGVARVALAAFAAQGDFTLTEIEEIKVAVSEAVSNAVLHAYPGSEGDVLVTASLEEGLLHVVIRDRGRGIADIAEARQPSFSTEPGRMGLGFVFMESFMDQVEVSSTPGQGTQVTMTRKAEKAGREQAS